MNPSRHVALTACFSALLMSAFTARAQTTETITAARSQYTNRDAGEAAQLAQFSRPRPIAPPPYRGRPMRSYQTPWSDHGHALLGAAIGFGLGGALGAKYNTSTYPGATARAVFLCGGVAALLGAAIGANHGRGPYAFAHHKRTHQPARIDDSSGDLNAAADSGSPPPGPATSKVRAAVNSGLTSDLPE